MTRARVPVCFSFFMTTEGQTIAGLTAKPPWANLWFWCGSTLPGQMGATKGIHNANPFRYENNCHFQIPHWKLCGLMPLAVKSRPTGMIF